MSGTQTCASIAAARVSASWASRLGLLLAHPAPSERGREPSAPTTSNSPSLPTRPRRPSRGRRRDPRLPARPRHPSSATSPPSHLRHSCASARPRAPPAPPHIPGGQGRESQHHVAHPREQPAKLRAGLEGRLGRRSGRRRLTLICESVPRLPRLHHPPDLIVSRLGLGRHLAELCGGSGQIAAATSAPSRARSGTDASWTCRRSRRRGRVLLRRPRAPRAGHPRWPRPAPARRGSGSTATGRPSPGPGRSPRRSMAGPPRRR